ncbi:hypothetical protein LTR80_012324, partial [Exophiala xenobiotica]
MFEPFTRSRSASCVSSCSSISLPPILQLTEIPDSQEPQDETQVYVVPTMEEWARKEVAATTEQGGSHAVIDLLRSERNEGVDLSSSPLIAPAPPPPSVIGDSQPRRLSLLSHFSFSSDLSEADAEWEKDETVRALRIELGLEDKVLVSMSAEDRMKLAIEAVDQGDYLAPAAASR